MGISTEKLLGLGQLFNQAGTMYAAPGSSQAAFNERMADTFSTQQQAVALRKQKEAEEKKRKSSLFGSIGSTLGTIAGFAIPGVGPIVGPAIGAALGGSAGKALGGGGFNAQDSLMYGAQGAMAGFGAKMLSPALSGGGTYTGAMKNGLFDPIGKFTPAASTGFGSKLFNNPNVKAYFQSQMMPSQGVSSMFQPVQDGLYMNRNAMQNGYNPYGYGV